MQNQNPKERILAECIRKQQSVIQDFTTRLHEIKENEENAADEELDGSRQGQKAQADSEFSLLNNQLEFAIGEMNLLENLQNKISSPMGRIDVGAVVVTDKLTFFISVSIEQFTVDGRPYVGLSTYSPLFEVMKDKKTGESFSFNKTKYTISEIY
jgi:hypothetical protein